MLARATDAIAHAGRMPEIRFAVVADLRGHYPEKSIVLSGGAPFAGASPESDFSRARPGAFVGSCTAFDYRLGRLYVLFLERSDGAWRQHLRAFSRVNEEVASATSPWVEAVRAYSRVADLGDYEREKLALQELAKIGGPAIARDVALHFRTPTPAKSEADLLTLYRAAGTDRERSPALWALTQYGGPETATLVHGLLAAAVLPPELAAPAIAWAERQHAERELANIVRHASRRPRGQHWSFLSAIATLGDSGDLSAVEPLIPRLDDEELASLGQRALWLRDSAPAIAEVRRRVGDSPREASSLAFVLATWDDQPTLERALADLGGEGDRRWVEPYVVARSTRPEVPAALTRILATQDADLLAWFVEGLIESQRVDRLELLATVLAKSPLAPEVVDAARKALHAMDDQGLAGADALRATLPPQPAGSD